MAREKINEDKLFYNRPLPGESFLAYSRFCVYRDLPSTERSIRKVAEILGNVSEKAVQRMSAEWYWIKRVRKYDAAQDLIVLAEREKNVALLEQTKAEVAQQIVQQEGVELAVSDKILQQALTDLYDEVTSGGEYSVKDVNTLVTLLLKVQKHRRILYGLPTQQKVQQIEEIPENTVYVIGESVE